MQEGYRSETHIFEKMSSMKTGTRSPDAQKAPEGRNISARGNAFECSKPLN